MRPWLTVGVLWLAAALNYIDRQALFTLFDPLRRDLHLSDLQLGLLSTAFLWVYGAFSPVGGYLADRFSRKTVILVSLGAWSVFTVATGAARSYPELLAARALMGLSEAFYLPAALALIADYHGERTRSLATGIHQSGLYAGIVLGGVGAGLLAAGVGWRGTFFMLGAAGIAYAALAQVALRDAARVLPAERPSWSESFGTLLRERRFILVAVVFGAGSMAYWMVYTWMPLHLQERFGMGLAGAGFSATFYIQVSSFIAILAGGWLSDRVRGSRASVQAAGFLLAGPFLYLTGAAATMPVLITALVLFGIGRGLYDCNVMPVVCEVIDARLRATAYGILNSIGCIAGGVMTAAAGALKSSVGLGGALEVSGALLVMCAGMLIVLARRMRRASRAVA